MNEQNFEYNACNQGENSNTKKGAAHFGLPCIYVHRE